MEAHQPPREIQRRGWIVIGVTFVTLGLVYGIWYYYSVFRVAFLREFGWSRSLVAGAFSVFVLGIFGMVPFTQFLFDRVGWRWTIRVLAALVVGFILGNLGTQMLLVHQVAYLVDVAPRRPHPPPQTADSATAIGAQLAAMSDQL